MNKSLLIILTLIFTVISTYSQTESVSKFQNSSKLVSPEDIPINVQRYIGKKLQKSINSYDVSFCVREIQGDIIEVITFEEKKVSEKRYFNESGDEVKLKEYEKFQSIKPDETRNFLYVNIGAFYENSYFSGQSESHVANPFSTHTGLYIEPEGLSSQIWSSHKFGTVYVTAPYRIRPIKLHMFDNDYDAINYVTDPGLVVDCYVENYPIVDVNYDGNEFTSGGLSCYFDSFNNDIHSYIMYYYYEEAPRLQVTPTTAWGGYREGYTYYNATFTVENIGVGTLTGSIDPNNGPATSFSVSAGQEQDVTITGYIPHCNGGLWSDLVYINSNGGYQEAYTQVYVLPCGGGGCELPNPVDNPETTEFNELVNNDQSDNLDLDQNYLNIKEQIGTIKSTYIASSKDNLIDLADEWIPKYQRNVGASLHLLNLIKTAYDMNMNSEVGDLHRLIEFYKHIINTATSEEIKTCADLLLYELNNFESVELPGYTASREASELKQYRRYLYAKYETQDETLAESISNLLLNEYSLAVENSNLPYNFNSGGKIRKSKNNNMLEIKNGKIDSKNIKLNNYPNPFNPTTTISFNLEQHSIVNLKIYNLLGQEVKQLLNESIDNGYHQVFWDGTDNTNNSVSSGTYIYSLRVGDKIYSKKMLFVK